MSCVFANPIHANGGCIFADPTEIVADVFTAVGGFVHGAIAAETKTDFEYEDEQIIMTVIRQFLELKRA